MPSIDERVVSMAFENAIFEQRVAVTMQTLSKLNDAIAKTGAVNGLSNIEKDANKVTLNAPLSALDKLKAKFSRGVDAKPISDIEKAGDKVTLEQPGKAVDKLQQKIDKGIDPRAIQDLEKAGNNVTFETPSRALDNLTNKFSVLQGAASVAFGNITSQAAMKGAAFGKSFAFGPIQQGFQEYQTNLGSIQTILSNTQGQQVSGLGEVKKHLNELNTYSDKTIYNFSEMAKNIGTFTAAGVDLDKSTASIKGIANLAALSGSNSQQASTAMYQLSQAISSGRVGLQDWNSVVNAGMGGAVFQKSLMRTAENMGTIEKGALKVDKATGKATVNGESFRNSIMAKPGQESWLTSDVLTSTLEQLTGDMTDAQLKAKGFTDEQIKAIQAQAKSAQDAATQVKTLPQVFDVARETIGSGWSTTFQNIFGDFNESKKTFTDLSNTINGFINTNSQARNKVLKVWHDLGGRTVLITGIKDAFQSLMAVLGTVKDAFREVFPAKTGKDLFEMTRSFTDLMKSLKPSKATLENLKSTFAGVFAVLHIGWSIIKEVGGVLFDLLGIAGKGGGAFLNFTGGIGNFLVAIDKALTKGGLLHGFFQGLEGILRTPIELIKNLGGGIASLFGGFDNSAAGKLKNSLTSVGAVLTPMEKLVLRLKAAWSNLSDVFGRVEQFLAPMFDKIKGAFSTIGDAIAEGLKNADMDKILLAFQTTFLGGIFVTLKKAFKGGGGIDLTGGVLGQLKDVLGGVTGQLTAMQKQVQANTLLKIGAAMLVLAGAIYILSTIEPKKLASAMTAVAVGLGELGGALKIMSAGGLTGGAQMAATATAILILAAAMLALSVSVKIFSTMSWDELGRGLAGVAGSLVAIGAGMKTIGAARLIPIAAGLLLVGVALNLIASATKIFAQLSWEEIGRGLGGILGSLVALGAGLDLMGPSLLLVGPGLIAAAFGVTILAAAVAAFGAIKFDKALAGILSMGLALTTLGIALWLMPPDIALIGAGLIIAATGMTILASAIGIMGNLKIGTLIKGLIAMGAALVEMSVGLYLMIGTLPGSLALLAAAAAFVVLGPALALMGSLPWSVILKGLAAMALSMGVIAVVGLVAAPALLAMGGALAVLGLGLTLIATAIYITAKGLALLGDNGAKGIGVLVTAITAFVALLPTLIINFVKGLVSIIEEVAKVAPKVVVALGVILDTVIAFIAEHATKFGQAVGLLIDAILEVIVTRSPAIIAAGLNLLVNLLSGISSHITDVVTKAGEIVTKFLSGLATQAPKIIASGAKLIAAYLNGIASNLGQVISAAGRVVVSFLTGVTGQLPKVIAKGAALIITFLNEIRKHVPDFVKAGAKLIISVIDGVGNQLQNVIDAGVRTIRKFLFGIAKAIPDLADIGAKAVIKFLNGTAKAIDDNEEDLWKAGANLARAIIHGMADGFKQLDDVVINAAKDLADKLPHWVKKVLGIKSPSTVFAEIGMYSAQGLAEGLAGGHGLVTGSAEDMSNGVIDTFKNMFQIQSPSKVLKDIGQEVGHGFRDGLDGSVDDIRNSFKSLREKINTEMATARDNIKTEKNNLADLQKQYADKLKEIANLRAEKKPDKSAIKSAQEEAGALKDSINTSIDAIQRYKGVLDALKGAKGDLVGDLQDEKKQLIGLSKEYDTVSKGLDAAQSALDSATRARDDAIKSYTDQYNQLPDFANLLSDALADADLTEEERQDKIRKAREDAEKKSRINQVALYQKALEDQIAATKKYQDTLAKLRAAGLDDATYKKLLAQGLSGQDFATQLLATGTQGIANINKLDAALLAESTGLATDAAKQLYQAGVDAAQGLVDGLTAKKAELAAAMDVIADEIVARIKSSLGIRSPSTVFAEVGRFAASGLVKGFQSSQTKVAGAAADIGEGATEALKSSLANLTDTVGSEIDTDLTITPVLDLSQAEKDASKIQDLGNVVPITAAASYGQASAISSATTQAAQAAVSAAPSAPSFSFEQNITSPKALSDIEIYRQTHNLLSAAKRGLGLPERSG